MGAHHQHSHAHRASRRSDRRRLVLALVVTSLVLVAETVGGLLSHSLALLSDAGHLLSDVAAQGLSLAALVIASRPPDARRSYGWYRVEILAALGNGLTLTVLAALVMWKGGQRMMAPEPVATGIMIPIAALGLVANLVAAGLLHDAHSLNVKGAYIHVLGDTLSSLVVLAGGAAMYFSGGLLWLDPLLSIAIGLFILYSSFALIRDAVDILLEAVPREVDLGGVTQAIAALPAVVAVHDLHVWTITSGLFALSAHVVVAPATPPEARDGLIGEIRALAAERFHITHTTLQIESESFEHHCHVC